MFEILVSTAFSNLRFVSSFFSKQSRQQIRPMC